jgi:hypothetical protein
LVIPGTIAIGLGVRQWRRERAVLEFATWLKSQRRINMDVMASRIGRSRFEAEKLLGESIEAGLVKGVINRTSDEFVVQRTDGRPGTFRGNVSELRRQHRSVVLPGGTRHLPVLRAFRRGSDESVISAGRQS